MGTKQVVGYTDFYIPDNFLPIEEFIDTLDDSFFVDNGIKKNDLVNIYKHSYGIKGIYTEDRKNEADIFADMLARYFEQTHTIPEDIDFIIYTRGNSVAMGEIWSMADETCINVPYHLQRKFRMKNVQVFNVEQECSTSLMSTKLALCLMGDGAARKIILLSRNFFEDSEFRLMGGTSLVSDGLGMMEIASGDSGLAILDFVGTTDGSISRVRDFSSGINQSKVVQVGSNLIQSLVQKNNLTMKDIARIIPQNISKNVWTFYCQLLDFPKDKVFLDNVGDGAHMGDVDIIRNITDVLKKQMLAQHELAIAYAIGTGTSWNAILLQAL